MKILLTFGAVVLAGAAFISNRAVAADAMADPADVILYNAKVLTVNSNFAVAQAVVIRDGKIVAVGKDKLLETYRGPETRLIDAQGRTIMPGLFDGSVNSYPAALSEVKGLQPPVIDSIAAAQEYIRREASNKPASGWIVLDQIFPTRLKEGRLPVKGDLDAATTNYAVYWNFGPLAVLNTRALAVSHITRETQDPKGGVIEKDPKHFIPTGLLRNASSLVRVPKAAVTPTRQQVRLALKSLYTRYNEQGITSIGEAQAGPAEIDLFRDLSRSNELTVRITAARAFQLGNDLDESIDRLDAMTNGPATNQPYGPTGAGDDWVRIGPLKTDIDGNISIGTAYLRTPYGLGNIFDVDELAYRGQAKPDSFVLGQFDVEAASRGWQLAGHASGDAALDFLLNSYEKVQFKQDITARRFLVMDSAFQASQDWRRLSALGVGVVIEPTSLYEDGSNLWKTFGAQRMGEYMAFKGWFDRGLTAGGASGHLAGTNSLTAANPWNPWLAMWTTLTRQTSQGTPVYPEEQLSREQAIRLYTINNAWLNFQEKKKGSLEAGKLADLIVVDTDVLKCPVDQVRNTRVLLTMVNGKVVWEANLPALPGPELVTPAAFTQNTGSNGPVYPEITPAAAMASVQTATNAISAPGTATGTTNVAVQASTNSASGTNLVIHPAATPAPRPTPTMLDGAEEATNAVAENKPVVPEAAATNSVIATNAATVITVSNQTASITVTIQPNVAATNAPAATNETAAAAPLPGPAPEPSTNAVSPAAPETASATNAPTPTVAATQPVAEKSTPAESTNTIAPGATAAPSATAAVAVPATEAKPEGSSPMATVSEAVGGATAITAKAELPGNDEPATNQVTDPTDWSHLISQDAK